MSQDIHTHLEKLKTELNKLEPAVKHLQDADRNTATLISLVDKLTLLVNSVLQIHENLINANETLIDKVDKVDFPIRLDKIDATVSAINHGLQNTQTRIGDLERNLKDDIQAKTKDVTSKIEASENSLKKRIDNFEKTVTTQFEKQLKNNKFLEILLFVSIGLIAGLIIFRIISGT